MAEESDSDKLVAAMRPVATEIAKHIAALGNATPHPSQSAGLIASLVFQNVVVTLAWMTFGAGAKGGEEFIRQLYAQALKDAIERWHKADLKNHEPG